MSPHVHSTLVRALSACMLMLPAAFRNDAPLGLDVGRTQVDAASVSTTDAVTPPSAPEQLAIKEAQVFLANGGDINAKDSLGTSRLTDAVLNDYSDLIVLLASKGADVNGADEQLDQTALHFCAIGDKAQAAAALIKLGADVNAKDHRGKTPLHEAAAAGALNLLKVLLSNKADVNARDSIGKTPIDRATLAHQEKTVALLLAAGSDPAHEPAAPTPVSSKSGIFVAKENVAEPTTPAPLPPPQTPTKVATESAKPTITASPAIPPMSPEIAAAQDLADMVIWWEAQAWVRALKKSMPRGVTVSMNAKPYDSKGWSEVELREHHSPDSGADPNVSPAVGFFRISRVGRKIEWMGPVSGEYEPLEGFIKMRGLQITSKTQPPKDMATASAVPSIIAGDFESKPPSLPEPNAALIVEDPTHPKNHVARINGPRETGFTLPATVPAGTKELAVSLRLLHPENTKLIRFQDGNMPEGIRLRVRLLNESGSSSIRDSVLRPTGQWREIECVFYDPPANANQVSVEAIWMKGPVYVDDVKIVPVP